MKIRNLIIILLILFFSITIKSYAKFNYNFNIKAFSLTRDNSEIIYEMNKIENFSENKKSILLIIKTNKPIEDVEGFEISDDKTILTRLIDKNESKTIILQDFSGNRKEVVYTIDNIEEILEEDINSKS